MGIELPDGCEVESSFLFDLGDTDLDLGAAFHRPYTVSGRRTPPLRIKPSRRDTQRDAERKLLQFKTPPECADLSALWCPASCLAGALDQPVPPHAGSIVFHDARLPTSPV